MKPVFCLIIGLSAAAVGAQPADLDDWSGELDLSILETPSPTPSPTEPPDVPAESLFSLFDRLPERRPPPENAFAAVVPGSDLHLLHLPAAQYLVVPNPPRVDEAYLRLTDAVERADLSPVFPLKTVLHADGNFSVAVALPETVERAVPVGTDLSPLPALRLIGIHADIPVARRDHPKVVNAFLRLREAARSAGFVLDTSEFYFLPRTPGSVFFALRVESGPDTGENEDPE